MKTILVNVDYDERLAGAPAQAGRMLALEFLAFWIVKDCAIRVHRNYPAEFLSHIQNHTGRRPMLKQQGTGSNWWGPLENLELEKKFNSKVWSFQWWKERAQLEGSVCFTKEEAVHALKGAGPWMLKRAQAMSGRGNKVVRLPDDVSKLPAVWFSEGVVIEPLRERVSDLSALWLPDEEKFLLYRNDIDERFQWRGVTLERAGRPDFTDAELHALETWEQDLHLLREHLVSEGYSGVFSVDAFFYRTDAGLRSHPCSEINARKTMGFIAYEFFKRHRPQRGSLRLTPEKLSSVAWNARVNASAANELVLSPPDAPFLWTWTEES